MSIVPRLKNRLKPFLLERKIQHQPRVGEEKGVNRKKEETSPLHPLLVKLTSLWAHLQFDGLLENWIWQMVDALKSPLVQPVNVVLADWITLAHQQYTIAIRKSRLVGQEVAALLQWLEVRPAQPPFP